jgi:hypothetical protein
MAVTAPTDSEFEQTKLSLYRNAIASGMDLSSHGVKSEDDVKNLTRADMASWVMDPKVIEEFGKQRMELIGGGKLSPEQSLARKALISRGNDSPNAADIQNELIRVDQKKNENKFNSLGGTRVVSVYDRDTGHIQKANMSAVNADPEKYVSGDDFDVKTLSKNQERFRATSQLVTTLDGYTGQATDIMKRTGLNQNSRLWNVPANKLKDVLGSGDYAALKNVISGIGADLGKIESGSLGAAGATVEALKMFKMDSDKPIGEYFNLFNETLKSGKIRKDAILNETKNIHKDLGFRGNPDSIYPTEKGSPPQPQGPGVLTATNPKTGQKIKSLDGGQTWQGM